MHDQSRRRFILNATAAAAAAPIISTSVTRAAARASRKKLGFAICGLGGLSTNQIAPALQKTKYCRLAGIVTGSAGKAAGWRAKYGIAERNVYTYETMHRLADDPQIDVVYVVTPNALHAQHAIAAARAGKHVFCEKPLEVSVERCQQMIDACRSADRLLGVGYRCQFEPHHLECIRLAREQEFGALGIIRAGFGIAVGNPDQWRLKRGLSGGGALMDVGIYALQATRYLTGEEPILVSGTQTRTDAEKFSEVDESVAWTANFPGGAIAHCSASFSIPGIQGLRANAQRGWFELDPAFFYDGIHGRRSDGKQISFAQVDQFAAEMDDFAQCILEHRPTKVPGEEGLRDVRIMMAIYESIRTGRAVKPA